MELAGIRRFLEVRRCESLSSADLPARDLLDTLEGERGSGKDGVSASWTDMESPSAGSASTEPMLSTISSRISAPCRREKEAKLQNGRASNFEVGLGGCCKGGGDGSENMEGLRCSSTRVKRLDNAPPAVDICDGMLSLVSPPADPQRGPSGISELLGRMVPALLSERRPWLLCRFMKTPCK
mmetsp:Transcript_140795/g.366552  ORF Transcript_140795/g.366552 Transcript_140795/m.366552 type:complete len:182 (-) Transcript_140795:553-1098(-)